MPVPASYWTPLPNASQLRLLRLVLERELDPAALDAWTASVDLQVLDEGSVRLLPALYAKLKSAGIDHPWLPIMRGWYRRTLYRNRLISHRGLDMVEALAAQGVASLLLKGCPLVALYYKDPGIRPMGDFDIMIDESVPRREVEAILAGSGRARLKGRSLHADTYADRDGFEYDLHWHLMPELAVAGRSRALWSRAIDVVIEGRRFRTLSAGDHIFHAIVHGMRVSDVPPLRWIVDVATIAGAGAKAAHAVDWLAIADQAERLSVAFPVARGLGFLVDAGILGEPAMAARALLAAAPQRDRLLFAGSMKAPGLAYRIFRPWLLYRRLARLSRELGSPGRRPGFARFLAELWNLESPREVPATAWRKIRDRLRPQSG